MNTFDQFFHRAADLQAAGPAEPLHLLGLIETGETALSDVVHANPMHVEPIAFSMLWLADLREKIAAGGTTPDELKDDLGLIGDSLAGIELPRPGSTCWSPDGLLAAHNRECFRDVPAPARAEAGQLAREILDEDRWELAGLLGDLLADHGVDPAVTDHLQRTDPAHHRGCFAVALVRALCG